MTPSRETKCICGHDRASHFELNECAACYKESEYQCKSYSPQASQGNYLNAMTPEELKKQTKLQESVIFTSTASYGTVEELFERYNIGAKARLALGAFIRSIREESFQLGIDEKFQANREQKGYERGQREMLQRVREEVENCPQILVSDKEIIDSLLDSLSK